MRSGDTYSLDGSYPVTERVAAVWETGLSAVPDAGMDRFARLVAGVIGVPVALVALLEVDRQVFPGMVGLEEPWAGARQTPLSHSLCRHVVADGEPQVFADVRLEGRTSNSPAISELGVVAYAGMPLVDADGQVLGSLCAIDTQPREWSGSELSLLGDLAAACSAELQLRIVSRRYRTSMDRSQLLLRAADALADTTGLTEVRQQVRDLLTSDLKPVYVGLVLVEGANSGRLRRIVDATGDVLMERTYETFGLQDAWPTARAARENRTITVNDPAALRRDYLPQVVEAFDSLGLHSAVCVPLPGTAIPLGTLVLGWDVPHEIDIVEQAVLASIAGYTARAVERALFVDSRIDAARKMQQAMLTDLPAVPGLETAALYRAAADTDLVGGDWYDAYLLPTPSQGGEDSAAADRVAISVGDITGHDMGAATLMGQVRSMLRQADLDHPGQGPARALSAMEHANARLQINASGTLIHAHLRPHPGSADGTWEMTWTNAGHPPPLVAAPEGSVERLDQHGILLFPVFTGRPREEYRRLLAPGSVLLLYTDGLIERAGTNIEILINTAVRLLAEHHTLPLDKLVALLADQLAGHDAGDDVALLAVRIPAVPGPDVSSEA
ncbi:SpoIIE family protein phosphatase [Streptomyces sp. NPDC005386]|uniref:GAF domain-containing SpoIIE family protein phosphatase n=1 Tax=Streptomyces sp. NPDC005386 TaxID=3154562 RepID=UPI0033A5CF38